MDSHWSIHESYDRGRRHPFAVTSKSVRAALARIRGAWNHIREEVKAKRYDPSYSAESKSMAKVFYKHLLKRKGGLEKLGRVPDLKGHDSKTFALKVIAKKKELKHFRNSPTRLAGLDILAKDVEAHPETAELVSWWVLPLDDNARSLLARHHRRWYVGAKGPDYELVPGYIPPRHSATHAAGAPPEVPPASIYQRISQVCGSRPIKISDGDQLPLAKYLDAHRPEIWNRMPRGSVYTPTGSFEASASHLGTYFGDPPPGPDDAWIDRVVTGCASSLNFYRIGLPTRDVFLSTGVKPGSAPGFDSKKWTPDKGHAIDVAGLACQEIWSELKHQQLIDTSIWEMGGREKRQWRDVGEQLKSRVIMQPEAILSQFGCAIAHPITLALQRNPGDLKVGWSYAHKKWLPHLKRFSGEHVKAFDWSQFDSHVGEKLMVASMGILRSFYPPSRRMDRAFIYLLSNLVFKDVLVPGGYVTRVEWGVPSGHPFTSLIDSVANWLVHKDTLYWMCGGRVARTTHLACLGDDTLMSFPDGRMAPDTAEQLRVAKERWGMVGKLEHNLEGFLSSYFSQGCLPFLGTRFQAGFPGVSLEDWVTMDLGDRAPRTDPTWRALEIWVYRGLPPFCSEQWELHMDLCRDLLKTKGNHLVINPYQLECVADEVLNAAARVYLTTDSGAYAWAEDMAGSRANISQMNPRQRPPVVATSLDSLGSRFTPEKEREFHHSHRRASAVAWTDPITRRLQYEDWTYEDRLFYRGRNLGV